MMMLDRIFFVLVLCLFSIRSNAQIQGVYPRSGDKLTHEFKDIVNGHSSTVSIEKRSKKWLVLDFWGQGCTMCIASMPKMNKLSKSFADQGHFLMLGIYGKYSKREALKKIFMNLVKRNSFVLASALDSTVQDKFDIGAIPSIFIIDPEGKLVAKALTIDSVTLSHFINGEMPDYQPSYSAHEPINDKSYDVTKPLLAKVIDARMKSDSILYSSMLAKWDRSLPGTIYGFDERDINNRALPGYSEAIGLKLRNLYLLAYTGSAGWGKNEDEKMYRSFSRKPILEIKNTSPFKETRSIAQGNTDNLYAYSLNIVSFKKDFKKTRNILLNDLNRTFGYSSSLESREVDILKLVIKDQNLVKSRLKSKGRNSALKKIKGLDLADCYLSPDSSVFYKGEDGVSIHYYNVPFKIFFENAPLHSGLDVEYCLKSSSGNVLDNPPLIDGTGLDFRIDFSLNNDYRNWESTLETLRSYGLDVVPEKMMMQSIVIRDAKASDNEVK